MKRRWSEEGKQWRQGPSRSRAAKERERLEWPEGDRRDLEHQAAGRTELGQGGGKDGGAGRRRVHIYC